MEIHLDPLGGWSGDMFAAALLDAFPEFWPEVEAAVAGLDLGPDAAVRLVPHRDHALTGHRFVVAGEPRHSHDHPHPGSHGHRRWSDIREMIAGAPIHRAVRDHATAIFRLLAGAEAEVHGVAEDEVTFHEVGAVDSIVDVVTAAQLIALAQAAAWSSAPLPLGSGRVRTQHGILPVPTPATALLLRDLPTLDDGVAGERVTPTGAAIARHLLLGEEAPSRAPRLLRRTGTGFGTRTMPDLSNCLRALVFEPASERPGGGEFAHRELGVVTFEVDDLSAEDLANGLDHVRALPGVHDVVQGVVFGKKGRVATQVQVLAAPEALERAIEACFTETTTIGLRFHTVRGAVLPRVAETVEVDGRGLRVKLVRRPDGVVTAKTEASDVASAPGHAARLRLRREGEDRCAGSDPRRFGAAPEMGDRS